MAETIAARADEVNTTLRSTGEALARDLGLRGSDVVGQAGTDRFAHHRYFGQPRRRGGQQLPRKRGSPGAVDQQPRRRGQGHAGHTPAGLRGHVQPRRHCACRKGLARLHHARRPDHAPHRRIRPHGEELWRRTGGASGPAHPGCVRSHAQLRRYVRSAGEHPRRRTYRFDRRAALAVRRDPRHPRLRPHDPPDRRRQADRRHARRPHRRGIRLPSRRAAPKWRMQSAPRSSRSTRRWARTRSKSPTRSTAASPASRICWSGAPKPSPISSRPAPRPPPTRCMPAWKQLGQSIKSNSADAERSLGQIALTTSETLRNSAERSRAQALGRQRRGRPQLRRQGRRDHGSGQPAHQRAGGRAVRQERQRARRHQRKGPAIRQRRHQSHRRGDEVDRGKGPWFHAHDAGQRRRNLAHDQQRGRSRHQYHQPQPQRSARHRAASDRAVENDRDLDRQRDAGNAQHAARRHHRVVRAAARSQHHVAGGAFRLARQHERARKHAGAARVGVRHRHERSHRRDRRGHRPGGKQHRRFPRSHRAGYRRSRPARQSVR